MLRIFWILLGLLSALMAENFAVITHKDTPIKHLTQEEVSEIYLKKRRFSRTLKLTAINLPARHSLRKEFEKKVLQMNKRVLERYWMQQHYKGKRPPYPVASIESVLMYVQKKKGVIGYIPLERVTAEVKVLYRVLE